MDEIAIGCWNEGMHEVKIVIGRRLARLLCKYGLCIVNVEDTISTNDRIGGSIYISMGRGYIPTWVY